MSLYPLVSPDETASMGPRPANAPPDFDRLARAYPWMEWTSFGPFLGICRAEFLPCITNCRSALVLGDGDGRFTARLLRECQSIRVHAVDASHAMLATLCRACTPNAARLTTEHADLRISQPHTARNPAYDLVVTHFFLDCLSTGEVLRLAHRIRKVVSPGALWVVSEFAVPPGWFGRRIAAPIIHCLYIAFGLLTGLRPRTLPDHASGLSAAGFTRIERRPRLAGLLVSELWTTGGQSPGGQSLTKPQR